MGTRFTDGGSMGLADHIGKPNGVIALGEATITPCFLPPVFVPRSTIDKHV